MQYIIIAVIGLLILVALFTYVSNKFFKKKTTDGTLEKEDDVVLPDATCCGAHEVCEKGLKKMEKEIDYYDDEELDALANTAADAYSDEQVDQFRDILYSLRKEEIENWIISLEKREINYPEQLKQETIELLNSAS